MEGKEKKHKFHTHLLLNQFAYATRAAVGAFPFRFRSSRKNVLIKSQTLGMNWRIYFVIICHLFQNISYLLKQVTISITLGANEHF